MRNTIVWVAVVIFLGASYVLQDPAGDPYTRAVRNVFTTILVVLVPVISAVVIFAWVGALRRRSGR